jgi:HEAT repeat protein
VIQASAVKILGEKGDAAGIEPLTELLGKTSDESLRAKVEAALAMIRECQPE